MMINLSESDIKTLATAIDVMKIDANNTLDELLKRLLGATSEVKADGTPKKRPGRPKGQKNKPKPVVKKVAPVALKEVA